MSESIMKSILVSGAILSLTACGGGGGGNTAPTLANTSVALSSDEDTQVAGSINASDADGDTLGYAIGAAPTNGSLTVNQDGTFTYTPNRNYFGSDAATIIVSDSIATITANLSFTINNVNDLPTINTSSLVVGSNGQTNGEIDASDVDGDTLTFAVVTQPQQGTVEINSSTGTFTFTANELATVNDSFVVSVSDGIGDRVTATIDLGASYASNEDKLTYYYASSHSHITQAEAMILNDGDSDAIQITDAEVAQEAYIKIAIGYAQAGFADLSRNIITDNIITRQGKAEAYQDAAVELDEIGAKDIAQTFRTAAIAEYNAYIAEIGLANIGNSDTQFYRSMVEDYIEANELAAATDLLTISANLCRLLIEFNARAHDCSQSVRDTGSRINGQPS